MFSFDIMIFFKHKSQSCPFIRIRTLAGFYGVALAASAMMATTAMQLAIDAFGPISDNAGSVH